MNHTRMSMECGFLFLMIIGIHTYVCVCIIETLSQFRCWQETDCWRQTIEIEDGQVIYILTVSGIRENSEFKNKKYV